MTAVERGRIWELVSAAVHELDRTCKLCPRCKRWLSRNEYGRDRRYCIACEALRILDYREPIRERPWWAA